MATPLIEKSKQNMTTFHGSITSPSFGIYHAKTRNSTFEMAADHSASSPVDALLASLCGCMAHYVGEYYREQKMPHLTVKVSAESVLTEDGTRLADITVTFLFDQPGLAKSHHAAVLKAVTKCYIYQTLRRNSKIHFRIAE